MVIDRDMVTHGKKRSDIQYPGHITYKDGILEIKAYHDGELKESLKLRFAQAMAATHKHPLALIDLLIDRYWMEVEEIEGMFDDVPDLNGFYASLNTDYDRQVEYNEGWNYNKNTYDYNQIVKVHEAFKKKYGLVDKETARLNGKFKKAQNVWRHEDNLIAYYPVNWKTGTYACKVVMPFKEALIDNIKCGDISNPQIMPYPRIGSKVVEGALFKSLVAREAIINYEWSESKSAEIYAPALKKVMEFLDLKKIVTINIASREGVFQFVQNDITVEFVADPKIVKRENDDIIPEVIRLEDLGK